MPGLDAGSHVYGVKRRLSPPLGACDRCKLWRMDLAGVSQHAGADEATRKSCHTCKYDGQLDTIGMCQQVEVEERMGWS